MRLFRRCLQCEAILQSGGKYCAQCGAPITIEMDPDPQKVIRSLKTINLSICVGILALLGFVAFLKSGAPLRQRTGIDLFLYFLIPEVLLTLPLRYFFRHKVFSASQRNAEFYRRWKLIDGVLLASPALFAVIVYFLSWPPNTWIALGIIGILLVLIIVSPPRMKELEAFADGR